MDLNVLKQMGDTGCEAVLIYNFRNQQFLYYNPVVSILLEKPLESFIREPDRILSLIHPEDLALFENLYHQLSIGTRFIRAELRLQAAHSGYKFLKIKAYTFSNGPEDLIVAAFAEDITGLRSHENYLLEFGNKKNSALEVLAHDLSGPLNIAKTLASTLEQESEKAIGWQTAEYTRIIQQVCESSLNLIGDILTDEHLKSPMVALRKMPVNLVALTREIVKVYQSVKTNREAIKVSANTEELYAAVDKIKYSQIINNLISNAIKFTPEKGSIRLSLTDTGHDVLIALTDTGIGIPDNLKPFLFARHTKAVRPGLGGEPARGIGMYITRILVELHHGKIWFESKENVGTTFYVLLPKS